MHRSLPEERLARRWVLLPSPACRYPWPRRPSRGVRLGHPSIAFVRAKSSGVIRGGESEQQSEGKGYSWSHTVWTYQVRRRCLRGVPHLRTAALLAARPCSARPDLPLLRSSPCGLAGRLSTSCSHPVRTARWLGLARGQLCEPRTVTTQPTQPKPHKHNPHRPCCESSLVAFTVRVL